MKEIIATYFVLLVSILTGAGQVSQWIFPTGIENMNHFTRQLRPVNYQKSVLIGFGLVTEEKALVDLNNGKFDSDRIGWNTEKNNAYDFQKFAHALFFQEAVKRKCNAKVRVAGEQLKAGNQVLGKSLYGAVVFVIQF